MCHDITVASDMLQAQCKQKASREQAPCRALQIVPNMWEHHRGISSVAHTQETMPCHTIRRATQELQAQIISAFTNEHHCRMCADRLFLQHCLRHAARPAVRRWMRSACISASVNECLVESELAVADRTLTHLTSVSRWESSRNNQVVINLQVNP